MSRVNTTYLGCFFLINFLTNNVTIFLKTCRLLYMCVFCFKYGIGQVHRDCCCASLWSGLQGKVTV